MWKKLLTILTIGLSLSGCTLAPKRAAIEIMSNPAARVYLNGKEVGSTPYKNTSLKPEDVDIKLATEKQSWAKTIKLRNHTNTVINWEFDDKSGENGGYILSMEKTGDLKKASLIVNAIPDKAAIMVQNEIKGMTPSKIEDIGEDDKPVTISYPAYKSQNVYVKPVRGYQIIIDAVLIKEAVIDEINPADNDNDMDSQSLVSSQMIIIMPTETGWLRVRRTADSNAAEIARVKPGEKFKLISETQDWYQIELGDGSPGWISTKYAEKISE